MPEMFRKAGAITDPFLDKGPNDRAIIPAPGKFQFNIVWKIAPLLVVMLTALAVLILGWWGGITGLTSLHRSFAAMVPSTALLFALCSAALILWWISDGKRFSAIFLQFIALLSIVVSAINITFITLSPYSGIDAAIWPKSPIRKFFNRSNILRFAL